MRTKGKSNKVVKLNDFESALAKGTQLPEQHVETRDKGAPALWEVAQANILEWADNFQELCSAGEELIQRDNTISRLEAELSSVKKENDDLRQETRWTLDQVQHRIAQLEAQNAFYADVISTDRAKAEKTKIQLYHTVTQLLKLVPTLPLASEDELVLKFARCLPVGEANARGIDSVWGHCEDTLFPLSWDEHYFPIYGAPQLLLDRHPQTFFRRADGAYYLPKPAAPMMPLPAPRDIKTVAGTKPAPPPKPLPGPPGIKAMADPKPAPPTKPLPGPPGFKAMADTKPAPLTKPLPGSQGIKAMADRGPPPSAEGERPAPLADAPPSGGIPGQPLFAPQVSQASATSLEPWFPHLRSEHLDMAPPMPQGAPTEPSVREAKHIRVPQGNGHGPHPSPAPPMPQGAPTEPLVLEAKRMRGPQGNGHGPHPSPAPPMRQGAPTEPLVSQAERMRGPQGNGHGPDPLPASGMVARMPQPAPVTGAPQPPFPVVTPLAPLRDSRAHPPRQPPAKVGSSWTNPRTAAATTSAAQNGPLESGSGDGASRASLVGAPQAMGAPRPQLLVVTPLAPPRDSRPPLARQPAAKVASSWAKPKNAAATVSVSSNRGPTPSPCESVENSAARTTRGPALPTESVENIASTTARGSASVDCAAHTSTVVGTQVMGAPRRAGPGGEGLLSKAGLSKSALKRMKKRAAKAA